MLVSKETVARCLKEILRKEDQKHIEDIVDLSWAGALIFELAFQWAEQGLKKDKESFFKLVQNCSVMVEEMRAFVSINDVLSNNQSLPYLFQGPRLEDITTVSNIFYRFVIQEKKITSEAMLKWLGEAWDWGKSDSLADTSDSAQMNQWGVVTSFGMDLVMNGKKQGLLPD